MYSASFLALVKKSANEIQIWNFDRISRGAEVNKTPAWQTLHVRYGNFRKKPKQVNFQNTVGHVMSASEPITSLYFMLFAYLFISLYLVLLHALRNTFTNTKD